MDCEWKAWNSVNCLLVNESTLEREHRLTIKPADEGLWKDRVEFLTSENHKDVIAVQSFHFPVDARRSLLCCCCASSDTERIIVFKRIYFLVKV